MTQQTTHNTLSREVEERIAPLSRTELEIARRILITMERSLFFTRSTLQPQLQLTGAIFGPVLESLVGLGLIRVQLSLTKMGANQYYLPRYERAVEEWRKERLGVVDSELDMAS